MSEAAVTQWTDPYQGFRYNDETITTERDDQVHCHTACGIDPAVFGDIVDPSNYIRDSIRAGVRSGITAEGNVNMLTKVIQHRPVKLGEALRVQGVITAVDPVPRGRTVDTEVVFLGADGEPAITTKRKTLKPDPDKAGVRGAGERPAPVVDDPATLTEIASYTLTPERVKSYSSEGNSIHYDMEAANKAGFRAPLIGGGMGVHYLMAELWKRYNPKQLDFDVYFRRPIFWDETVTVRAQADPWSACCLTKDGKVATEVRINSIAS